MLDGAPQSLEQEIVATVLKKVQRAKQDFQRHKRRISDAYRYALPWRTPFDRDHPVDQLDDIYDDILMSVIQEFAAEMLATFTPQNSDWIELGAVEGLDAAIEKDVAEQVGVAQRVIFAEMRRSNLHQALQASYLDLSVSTMSLTVQDIALAEPLHCEAIPMTELLITRGPYGFIDGWFREKKRRVEDIRTLWPEAKMPDEKPWGSADQEHEVIDGCWRDWSNRGTETNVYVVLIDQRLAFKQTYLGDGSRPDITARWSTDSMTAWGVGPTYLSLPSFMALNHIVYLQLMKLDEVTDPTISYVNDGMMNLENKPPPGSWVPRAPGSEPPEAVESKGRFDVAFMQADELRSAIKRNHFQDRPEQRGKTPPSASQWMDESAERMRRMGTPATNLVVELQYRLFKRFAFLLTKRGILKPLTIQDEEGNQIETSILDPRFVSMTPISPLLRAQEQEELLRIVRAVEVIVGQFGPQIGAIVVDIFSFAAQVQELLGVGVMRGKAEIDAAIKQLMPVLEASSGGGQPLDPASLAGPNG
jgi:hypothetical protein